MLECWQSSFPTPQLGFEVPESVSGSGSDYSQLSSMQRHENGMFNAVLPIVHRRHGKSHLLQNL
jgi:hypothetical protein